MNAAVLGFIETPETFFKEISIDDVFTNPPPVQKFVWGDRIPQEALTLLSAHGGVGKSTFALEMAICYALGIDFLDQKTEQGRVLYFSAEDSADTVRRRVSSICRSNDYDPAQVSQNLIVVDGTDHPVLFEESNQLSSKVCAVTESYIELKKIIDLKKIDFLIVDNASDAFGANPIDRRAVTTFIRSLTSLVADSGGSVLLLAHVAKSTSRAGKNQSNSESYADSAAWHNAARSRLFMNIASDDGDLVLMHQKSNYGRLQDDLTIRFKAGGAGFEAVSAGDSGRQGAERITRILAARPLLTLIDEFYQRGEFISPSRNSPSANAFAVLHAEPEFPVGLSKPLCLSVISELVRDQFLEAEQYTGISRKPKERLSLTPKGKEFISESSETGL